MIKDFIVKFGQRIGMDKSIAFTSSARIIQGFTGVGTVFFIATFLSEIEQGFYYAFGSILALQVFFEFGLTGIITQYFSHEAIHLKLNGNARYAGDVIHLSRLASLIRLFVKWYAILSIICLFLLTAAGFIYFNKYGSAQSETVNWEGPWILLCIATAIKLFQAPLSSGLQGLGYVKDISKIGFLQQILVPIVSWGGLALGLNLYVLGIGYILGVIIWFTYTYKHKLLKILLNLYKENIIEKVDYWKEIFPYQWKIALSWVSGYFIFQLFVPVLFATEGAAVAGQMGLTLQALSAVQALSLCWINTKVPLLSGYIAQKDFSTLDRVFSLTVKQMATVCTVLLISFLSVVWILKLTQLSINGNIFGNRFLDYIPLILMCIPVYLNQYTGAWATYLRCHKQEPFLILSIVTGLLCLCSTYFLGKAYGLYGMTVGYCLIQFGSMIWANRIFNSKRKQWHNLTTSNHHN